MMFAYRYTPVFLDGGASVVSAPTQPNPLFQPSRSFWDWGVDWSRWSPFSGYWRRLLTDPYRPWYIGGSGDYYDPITGRIDYRRFMPFSAALGQSVSGSGSTGGSGGRSAGAGVGGGQGGAAGAQRPIVYDRINLSDADKAYLFRQMYEDVMQHGYDPKLQQKFWAAANGVYQLTDQDIQEYYTQRQALHQRRLSEQAAQQQAAQRQEQNARWERLWETLLMMMLFRGMMGG